MIGAPPSIATVVPGVKLVPVTVTVVPPAVGPEGGVKPVDVGIGPPFGPTEEAARLTTAASAVAGIKPMTSAVSVNVPAADVCLFTCKPTRADSPALSGVVSDVPSPAANVLIGVSSAGSPASASATAVPTPPPIPANAAARLLVSVDKVA